MNAIRLIELCLKKAQDMPKESNKQWHSKSRVCWSISTQNASTPKKPAKRDLAWGSAVEEKGK